MLSSVLAIGRRELARRELCLTLGGCEGCSGEAIVGVDTRVNVVAMGGAAPSTRDDADDLAGAHVDRWTARVTTARRAIDLELSWTEDGARGRVRARPRGEHRALRTRNLVTDDVERSTAEPHGDDDISRLYGRVQTHRQNGRVHHRPIENEERDVRITEHLPRRMKGADGARDRHVDVGTNVHSDVDRDRRRIDVFGEVIAVVRTPT